MELSHQEYPAMLSRLEPSQAVALLNDRVTHVAKVNTDIADWLQERRRVEEQYVQGLRKLARRQPPDEHSEMGMFAVPWQTIIGSAQALADLHQNLAAKIEADIERPLRNFMSSNREVQNMSNMQGNLAALAKEYDAAQKKSDKARDRAGNAGKATAASLELENASAQWDSQAPFVFEQLQALDESRCNNLRDVLTQLLTHEADQVARSRITIEKCLNTLLNVQTIEEIKTFSSRQAGTRRRSDARTTASRPSTSRPSATLASSISRNDRDDGASHISVQEERKGGFRGLKRLGTVIGRRKGAVMQSDGATQSKSQVGSRQSSARPLAFSPGPSILESPPQEIAPSADRPIANLPQIPTLNGTHDSSKPSPASQEEIERATASSENIDETVSQMRSTFAGSNAFSVSEDDTTATQVAKPVATDAGDLYTSAAIKQAQQDAQDSMEFTSPPISLSIENAPIGADSVDTATAMTNLANTLRAQAVAPKRASTLRGRRDVRNTVFMPSLSGTESSSPANEMQTVLFDPIKPSSTISPPSPLPQSLSPSSVVEERTASDAQSIRSLGSSALHPQVARHAEMMSRGLNSSIIETVSAWQEHGSVLKAVVVGELALVYNQRDSFDDGDAQRIRLENFHCLEKVAPNPAFVQPSVGKPGEYSINLASIDKIQVAFRYQLHLDNLEMSAHVPLILTPSWRIEASQASLALHYSLNPAFATQQVVQLSNVVIVARLEIGKSGVGRPKSCQSKPAGNFSKDKALIYWKLHNVQLLAGQRHKLIARFATDGEAKLGRIEAKWDMLATHHDTINSNLGISCMPALASDAAADPFADDDEAKLWIKMECARKLCSGTYTAI